MLLWLPIGLALISFLIIMRWHQQLADTMLLKQTLIRINEDEISYLNHESIPFGNGLEFLDRQHNYAFDLDFFGDRSLFHHLNRTGTSIGSFQLAGLLKSFLSNEEILANQTAIKELSDKTEWRQSILALSKLTNDNYKMYRQLIQWSSGGAQISKTLQLQSFLLPAIFIVTGIISIVLNNAALQYMAGFLSLINLFVFFHHLKKIKHELFSMDKVHAIINSYATVLKEIETNTYESARLNQLKDRLKYKEGFASDEIKKLSDLFSSLDSIQNMMGAVIMNGISLYHIHVYHSLLRWKKEHGQEIEKWMKVIGTMEALNSLANFSYNNPKFCFPSINVDFNIEFKDLGHPLLNNSVRICNDIGFDEQKFIILTGSNMSGKSTFLRSLGVNMVLAGIGSAVCATSANIHPLPVLVSMRLSDSLADNESYFFAEVKRLHHIMEQLKNKRGFVLLDEILRGTNSDDKRSGTIEVIKKMVEYQAVGAIATHDIEVCKTTASYPTYLTNKRFETEIVNNELVFDYKIKEGICKNKSAYFLMKQMGVI
ncbi:MAG: DNA mismatch repair protein MutS [Chitinophagales bacterium]